MAVERAPYIMRHRLADGHGHIFFDVSAERAQNRDCRNRSHGKVEYPHFVLAKKPSDKSFQNVGEFFRLQNTVHHNFDRPGFEHIREGLT